MVLTPWRPEILTTRLSIGAIFLLAADSWAAKAFDKLVLDLHLLVPFALEGEACFC